MPEWKTAGEAADFGTLMMELFAYMGDTLNFYIDRTASEAFLAHGGAPAVGDVHRRHAGIHPDRPARSVGDSHVLDEREPRP